eukprot:NODE_1139_length_678_cov_459.677266_g781_i0.p1 GENE.NODE_1139_length_678_cov_459.677266_g781_i0~~NODE_1139_length_678_cov_459.677266_g781_i0.p1  ORF type:complete len:183 (-),score=69.84 NODE_1139_length_678_cov_459.677266_g781_i0:128-655(-)
MGLIGKHDRGVFHADGLNERMAVQRGWGDISFLGEEFESAVLLKAEGQCSPSNDAQLLQVWSTAAESATVAALKMGDWEHIKEEAAASSIGNGPNKNFFKKLADTNNKAAWELMPPTALMTAKQNKCKTRMFNKGWNAIQKNGKLASICSGAAVKCCGVAGQACDVDYNGFMNGV